MNNKQKVWAVILSIIIVALPLLALEKIAAIKEAQQWVFGLLQAILSQVQLNASSYQGKNMALVFVVLILLYMLLYLFFFVAGTLLYLLISSRWRKPVVFISYKIPEAGDEKDTAAIAKNIGAALKKSGFQIRMQPALKNPRHDTLNHSIKTNIRHCGALIAVPHTSRSSYVDAEIACAYHNDKPVYIIRYGAGQKLPATANSGHIVFNLQKLQRHSYKPLQDVMKYMHGYLPSRANLLQMPFEGLFPFDGFPFDGVGFLILSFLLTVLTWFNIHIQVNVMKLPMYIAMTLLGFYCAWQTLTKIYTYINLQKTARQTALNDQPTYKYLVASKEITEETLNAIEEEGLLM